MITPEQILAWGESFMANKNPRQIMDELNQDYPTKNTFKDFLGVSFSLDWVRPFKFIPLFGKIPSVLSLKNNTRYVFQNISQICKNMYEGVNHALIF